MDYQKLKKGIVPYEEYEQERFVGWLESQGLKFTAIPNSTYTKSIKQKIKNKAMGLRPGLPDLVVIGNNCLLFVEMKRIKGGTLSQFQREWIDALNKIPNVKADVCCGADAAKEFIKANI